MYWLHVHSIEAAVAREAEAGRSLARSPACVQYVRAFNGGHGAAAASLARSRSSKRGRDTSLGHSTLLVHTYKMWAKWTDRQTDAAACEVVRSTCTNAMAPLFRSFSHSLSPRALAPPTGLELSLGLATNDASRAMYNRAARPRSLQWIHTNTECAPYFSGVTNACQD